MLLQRAPAWILASGAPEEIRTPDPQIRSLVLYPAELRARVSREVRALAALCIRKCNRKIAKERFSYPLRPELARSGTGLLRVRHSAGGYARARSLRTLNSSTGRSGIAIRKVAPMVPSTR